VVVVSAAVSKVAAAKRVDSKVVAAASRVDNKVVAAASRAAAASASPQR
jgi:hypothetical protein